MALNLGELNAIITADDKGFNRTINRVHDKMDATGKRMGSLSGILGALGKATAFGALATGAAGLASALGPVISLAGTLGTAIVGLGAAVPAFAASGAAVIGTLTLAFQGMGDAIAGDEEALEKLPGPAKDFAKAVSGLSDEWEGLQKAVQSKFFEGLSDNFDRVARKILPHLQDGLVGVADGLSDMAASALDAMDSTEFLGGMTAVLASTEAGLKTAAEGMGGFVRGFGILMETFAPLIERAGLAVANLGESFGEWMAEAQATGQLNQLIQTTLDTLSTLGGIVSNVGSIFGSVFSAANAQGGGLLGVIEDLTGKAAAFFDSAEGKTALNDFFASLAAVADAVVPIVIELARAIGTDLAPHFATIATEVGPALKDLIIALGDAIGGIDVQTLAEGFVDVLGAVTALIGPVGEFLGWVSQIDGLVPVVVGALIAWTVAQWALNAAMYANPIVWIIALVIALIAIIVLLVVNWDSVVASFKYSWDQMVTGFKFTFNAIADFCVYIWDLIVTSVQTQVDALLGVVAAIGALPGRVWGWLMAMKDRAIAAFVAFVSGVNAKIDAILNAIQRMGGIPGKVAGFIQGAKDAAIAKFNSLVAWVKEVPDKIKNALGNLGNLLKDAGKAIIDGLLDGIAAKFGAVQDKLSDLTGMLPDWKGPERVDRKILGPAGEMVIGGFVDGLDRAIPSVQRALAGLTTDIGLQVDGSAGALRVEATTSLSAEDRALLRELAEARNQFDIRTDANTRVAEIRRDAMVVG